MKSIQLLIRSGGRIIEEREHQDMVTILRRRQTFSDASLLRESTMMLHAAGKPSRVKRVAVE